MKCVDAVWEKRNLGLDVVELTCTEDDTPEALSAALVAVNVPYSVVKVPAGCAALLRTAQECGYSVVEMGITFEGLMDRVKLPEAYARFLPHIRIEQADRDLTEKALREIASGEIFATDRIALDPHFSQEIAGKRYYHWSRDVLESGGEMTAALYKGRPIAFNLGRYDGESRAADGLIGGLFAEARSSGLGIFVIHCAVEYCRRMNGRKSIGRVSSNNIPIFRLHMQYGFSIQGMQYVLIRHQ